MLQRERGGGAIDLTIIPGTGSTNSPRHQTLASLSPDNTHTAFILTCIIISSHLVLVNLIFCENSFLLYRHKVRFALNLKVNVSYDGPFQEFALFEDGQRGD